MYNNMIIGIIYKYTSPSGKSYIGQTLDEQHRRNTWFCTSHRYAGTAINRARKKYGPENFSYEVLHKKYYLNKEEAIRDLDKWESYYIGYYDTYCNGYNNTFGGKENFRLKEESYRNKVVNKEKRSVNRIYKNYNTGGYKITKAASLHRKELIRSSGRLPKIEQYDSNGNFIKEWRCISEITEVLGYDSQNIYRACKTGIKSRGFYWRVKSDVKFIPHKSKTRGRKVEQYTLDGKYIRTFNSMIEAANFVNHSYTNISKVCRGEYESAYGYKWKYKEDLK